MSTDLITSPEYLPIAPEMLEVANTYLQTMDLTKTAHELDLPLNIVAEYIGKAEVQRYITEIYLNAGYRNRFKLGQVMDNIIDAKIKEMEEADITSGKDIIEIMTLAHKMRMDELEAMRKLEEARNKKPARQTNIQVNTGSKRSIFETLIEDVSEIT